MANSTTPSNTLKQRLSGMLGVDTRALKETVKDLPRVIKEAPGKLTGGNYDIGSKGSYVGGKGDATKAQESPAWWKESITDDWYSNFQRKGMRSRFVRAVTPDNMQRGYDDTVSNIPYDVEPINMEVLAMVEGGKKMQLKHIAGKDVSNLSGINPNAKGRYQIIPKWHSKDDSVLRHYGYKPYTYINSNFSNLTDDDQRQHANRYLKSLIGKYSDKFSKTDTRRKQDAQGKPVYSKDAKGHWSGTDGDVYTPAENVSGARAAALAAYNLGHNDLDKILDNPNHNLMKATGVVTDKKLKEVRGYLSKFVAEGELTAQEVIDAFPEMKGHIEGLAKKYHEHQQGRYRY
tara:strand:+ start:211 stop:1248 length:1038 start_codon:yes stop_codon:yes gene_type:complete